MLSNKPFACHDYLFDSPKCIKFMITYILQHEISLRMKFSNLGHDLLFQVMTQLTSYHYNMDLKFVYVQSMSSNQPFECRPTY